MRFIRQPCFIASFLQSFFRFWKRTVHSHNMQKQDASDLFIWFQLWKSHHQAKHAQAEAAEAVRNNTELELHYQKEIDQLKKLSMHDLELER